MGAVPTNDMSGLLSWEKPRERISEVINWDLSRYDAIVYAACAVDAASSASNKTRLLKVEIGIVKFKLSGNVRVRDSNMLVVPV